MLSKPLAARADIALAWVSPSTPGTTPVDGLADCVTAVGATAGRELEAAGGGGGTLAAVVSVTGCGELALAVAWFAPACVLAACFEAACFVTEARGDGDGDAAGLAVPRALAAACSAT